MPFKNNNKGLTLIELVIAIAILGIILVSFFGAFTNSINTIFFMGRKTNAVAEAQAVLDYVTTQGTINDTELKNNFPIQDQVDISDLTSSPYVSGKPIYYSVENVSVGSTDPVTMKKLTILVYYSNGNRYVTLTALVP